MKSSGKLALVQCKSHESWYEVHSRESDRGRVSFCQIPIGSERCTCSFPCRPTTGLWLWDRRSPRPCTYRCSLSCSPLARPNWRWAPEFRSPDTRARRRTQSVPVCYASTSESSPESLTLMHSFNANELTNCTDFGRNGPIISTLGGRDKDSDFSSAVFERNPLILKSIRLILDLSLCHIWKSSGGSKGEGWVSPQVFPDSTSIETRCQAYPLLRPMPGRVRGNPPITDEWWTKVC